MRALRLHGPHDLRLVEEPIPQPQIGQALVRVRSVTICHSDIHYYNEGRIGDTVSDTPLVLGHEFAGEVVEVTQGVTHVKPGDLVAVEPAISCGECRYCREGDPNLCEHILFSGTPPQDGALREYVAFGREFLFPLPAGLSADEGAMLEPLGVAIHAWDLADVRVGETVAIVGCGPIGLLLVQLALIGGASQVFAVEPLAYRRERAAALGAIPIPSLEQETSPELVTEIEALVAEAWAGHAWKGHGVDVAIEVAGTLAAQEEAARVVKRGGTVVLVGIPAEDQVVLPHHVARRKGLTIKMARRMKHTYPRAIELASHIGQSAYIDLKPFITHHFSLEEAAQAFPLVQNYSDRVLKAAVHP
ncbi:MAG: alcohol dehydrogenase catalytic domain-containing protein [Anaerolineae bacterium]|nr:alcohol dehydrogenase catalytic domain-containing protein [Anaerolineae bacterium]